MTTDIRPPRPAGADPAPASTAPPRLADGVELIGPYEDSGYREPPLMVRRSDGQLVQLPTLLYLIAERVDGSRSLDVIAQEVGDLVQRRLEPDDVGFLIDEKLAPLGIAVSSDGTVPRTEKADPLLGLRLRRAVISQEAVRRLSAVLKPLFVPLLVLAGVIGFVAFDVWLFWVHGIAAGTREALYQPGLLLMILAIFIAAAAFHESGHATACAYGGATPGIMGAGLYIVWPAFYTDVTDAYRLNRRGRLRTDLGGVYFNALTVLILGGIYLATGLEALLLAAFLLQFEMLHQMLPFLRLDGYYVVSDLVGVPDLFARIKPILLSFVPWSPTDTKVKELKTWVRFVVTGWVLAVVPLLIFQLLVLTVSAPRLLATAWDSLQGQWRTATTAFGDGAILPCIVAIVQGVLLLLPIAGLAYLFVLLLIRWVRGWRNAAGRPGVRALLAVVGGAYLTFAAWCWWPQQQYVPIQEHERWTLQSQLSALGAAAQGQPGAALFDAGPGTRETPSVARNDAPASKPAPDPSTAPGGASDPQASPAPSATPSATSSATASATASPTSTGSPSPRSSPSTTAPPTPSPAASP